MCAVTYFVDFNQICLTSISTTNIMLLYPTTTYSLGLSFSTLVYAITHCSHALYSVVVNRLYKIQMIKEAPINTQRVVTVITRKNSKLKMFSSSTCRRYYSIGWRGVLYFVWYEVNHTKKKHFTYKPAYPQTQEDLIS